MSDNKHQAAFHGESHLDHAWRTIPGECRGVTPTPDHAQRGPRPVQQRLLERLRDIVTIAVTAAAFIMFAGVVLAWFFDWKM